MTTHATFPMGFWNGMSVDDLDANAVDDWADAGMTLAMSPRFGASPQHFDRTRTILDAADRRGLRIILCHEQGYWKHLTRVGEEAYRRDVAAAIKALGDHPAVFGFAVGDEPGAEQFDDACRASRIQRELAPHLTPFLNLLPWFPGVAERVGVDDWGTYLDTYAAQANAPLLSYDCYCQMNPQTEGWDAYGDTYFSNLRQYGAAAGRAGIPFWTTLLSVGHFNYRCPKEDDLRWQLNTAVAHGAKGIFWFYFYMGQPPYVNYRVSPIDEHWERTETFQWLSRVNRTFLKRFGPVVSRLTLRHVSHAGKAWGGVPEFEEATGLVRATESSSGTPLIVSEFKDTDGRDAVMLVNNSQTENTVAGFTLRNPKAQASRIAWEGQEEALPCCGVFVDRDPQGVTLRQWLAPGQMELFMLG